MICPVCHGKNISRSICRYCYGVGTISDTDGAAGSQDEQGCGGWLPRGREPDWPQYDQGGSKRAMIATTLLGGGLGAAACVGWEAIIAWCVAALGTAAWLIHRS